MTNPFPLRLSRCILASFFVLLGLPATATTPVGVINSTTTNTTSTTQHETDLRVNLPTVTIPGNGVVNSQQLLKRIINSPDQTVIGWSLHKPLSDPQVQTALKTALAVLESEKPKFPNGARLLFKGHSTALSGSGPSSSTAMVGNVSLGTANAVSNTVSIGPGTILVGTDQSGTFFIAAGNQNINTNTHSEHFFENDFQTTITLGGQTRTTTETDVLGRTFFIDLDAVYSTLFSGLPVALAQREGLVAAHNFIGDVNGRIFRAWLGPNDSKPPQGDGNISDDMRVFTSGNVGWLSQNGGDTVAGLRDTREAASVGAEWKINQALRLGFAATYIHSDTDFSDDLGKQHIDGGALSVYATWRKPNWYADILYSAGLFNDTNNRNTLYAGNATSSSDDWSHLVSLSTGYIFQVTDTFVTGPYASLTYIHGQLEGSTEHGGGSAALRYGAQSYDSLVSSVGWQANWRIHQSWGAITPLLSVGWERENLRDAGDVSATLLQSPFSLQGYGRFGSFGVQTQRESAIYNALVIGAGVNFDTGERWTLNLSAAERTDFGPRNDFSFALRAEYKF